MKKILGILIAFGLLSTRVAFAHDTWLQTNTNLIRVGDCIYADLMMGNHGNSGRDFKIAGKANVEHSTLEVLAPDGKAYDLKPNLQDTGHMPMDGFWEAKFSPAQSGLYCVAHTFDAVMNYAPIRAIKSAKTFFLASKKLDTVSEVNPGFDRVLGAPLELIPQSDPVTSMEPGSLFKVRLLFKGKPLAGATISFIPSGVELKPGFDEHYERVTDKNGTASFVPKAANYYLVVAHVKADDEKGKGYNSTEYSAALMLFVPQICPSCDE